MPRGEEDEKGKKVHERAGKKIEGKGPVATYEEMRDSCYEFISKDKNFDACENMYVSGCEDCTRDRN